VGLVAAGLLALAGGGDDAVQHGAVAGAGGGEPQGVLEHHGVVAEDGDGEDGAQRGEVPVAVGVQAVAGQGRVPDVGEGALAAADGFRGPAVVSGVPEDLGGVDELEALDPGAELAVGAGDAGEGGGPDVEDVAGLVGVADVAGDRPHQGVLVGGGRVGDGLAGVVGGAAAPGGDLSGVADGVGVLGAEVGGQGRESGGDRVAPVRDRGPHPAQVGAGVQEPGVGEGVRLLGGLGPGGRGDGGQQSAGGHAREPRGAEERPSAEGLHG
jgi:hypothetical protein